MLAFVKCSRAQEKRKKSERTHNEINSILTVKRQHWLHTQKREVSSTNASFFWYTKQQLKKVEPNSFNFDSGIAKCDALKSFHWIKTKRKSIKKTLYFSIRWCWRTKINCNEIHQNNFCLCNANLKDCSWWVCCHSTEKKNHPALTDVDGFQCAESKK